MKKVLCLLLCLAMLCTFVGCGSEVKDGETATGGFVGTWKFEKALAVGSDGNGGWKDVDLTSEYKGKTMTMVIDTNNYAKIQIDEFALEGTLKSDEDNVNVMWLEGHAAYQGKIDEAYFSQWKLTYSPGSKNIKLYTSGDGGVGDFYFKK